MSGWLAAPVLGQSAWLPSHPRALSFSPASHQPPTAEGRRHELPTGDVVVFVQDHRLPLAEIAVAVRAGTYFEPPSQIGLSSVTAAMLRRGGAGERTAREFDDTLDYLAAELDSFSGDTRAGVRLSAPSWSWSQSLDLFFDLLTKPRLQPDRLDHLRAQLLERMDRRNQDPLEILEREWAWLMFGAEHPATRLQTPATLAAIETAGLLRYHQKTFRPGRLVFVASGDLEGQTFLTDLNRRLTAWREQLPAPEPDTRSPIAPRQALPESKPGPYVLDHDLTQAKVLLGHRLVPDVGWTPRKQATAAVLEELLAGSGAVSRLGGRLRTATGLVYRVEAGIDLRPPGPGIFRVFFEANNNQVAKAASLVVEEIERLRSELIHTKELEVVRRTLLSELSRSFDTAEKTAGLLAENDLLGRSQSYWTEYVEELEKIERKDVHRAAIEYFDPSQLTLLAIGRKTELFSQTAQEPSRLERLFDKDAVLLPARDPRTLEVSPAITDN